MSKRLTIRDEEWAVIYPILKVHPRGRVGLKRSAENSWPRYYGFYDRVVNGVYCPPAKANGIRCLSDFPVGVSTAFGGGGIESAPMSLIYKAFFIDFAVSRAHPCAAGAAHSQAEYEALGRSRGGLSTKVHAITDTLGKPLDFVLTGGDASDIGEAETLLALTPAGDKGYGSDALVQAIQERDMKPVIPRNHRTEARECDWLIYKERHLIECFFDKIKHYRRIFSRYEKRARNYMGFLRFVAALIWLR